MSHNKDQYQRLGMSRGLQLMSSINFVKLSWQKDKK